LLAALFGVQPFSEQDDALCAVARKKKARRMYGAPSMSRITLYE